MLLTIVGLTQCKTTNKVNDLSNLSANSLAPQNYDGRVIQFGTGGGFTGQIQQWTLFDNGLLVTGEVVSRDGDNPQLEKKVTDQMFQLYDDYGFRDLQLNEPDNLYFFLTMKDKQGEHKLVWGDKKIPILNKYHQTLYQLVKSKTPTKNRSKSQPSKM